MGGTFIDELLKNRNRNLGAMFAADLAGDYLRILYALLRFRRGHELEVLREDLFRAAAEEGPLSCAGGLFDQARFDSEIDRLDEWGLVTKRLEKTRLRSYKDVRRDRFRYGLPDETAAFLQWLEERHENDLLPRGDDSVNLLEFILSSLKQVARALKAPEENFSAVVFALGDVQEKTARLSGNLSRITVRLGEFLLRAYTPAEAREAVDGLDVYFKRYLEQLFRLRGAILRELEGLGAPGRSEGLARCFELFAGEQARRPVLMRVGAAQAPAGRQLEELVAYYRRGGKADRLCGAVHENAMKTLGKLTSYLKELERRSNRLEFIDLCLHEWARRGEGFEPAGFLRDFLRTAAAPLDMNDSDGCQKAEPPAPRAGGGKRRAPPRLFARTPRFSEKRVETHEEMRRRRLAEFLRRRYPEGGPLEAARIGDGEFRQVALLLKYGLLGGGARLAGLGASLSVDASETRVIAGRGGSLSGPAARLLRPGEGEG